MCSSPLIVSLSTTFSMRCTFYPDVFGSLSAFCIQLKNALVNIANDLSSSSFLLNVYHKLDVLAVTSGPFLEDFV